MSLYARTRDIPFVQIDIVCDQTNNVLLSMKLSQRMRKNKSTNGISVAGYKCNIRLGDELSHGCEQDFNLDLQVPSAMYDCDLKQFTTA